MCLLLIFIAYLLSYSQMNSFIIFFTLSTFLETVLTRFIVFIFIYNLIWPRAQNTLGNYSVRA